MKSSAQASKVAFTRPKVAHLINLIALSSSYAHRGFDSRLSAYRLSRHYQQLSKLFSSLSALLLSSMEE
jgi:hypothetical protein